MNGYVLKKQFNKKKMRDETTILKLENLKLKNKVYKQYTNIKILSILSVLEFIVIFCLLVF